MFKLLRTYNTSNVKLLYSKNKYQLSSILKQKTNSVHEISDKNESIINKANALFNINNAQPNIKLAELLVNKSSSSIQPYLKIMRIHRPIGSWLLFWPCSWGLGMAAAPGALPDLYLLTLFGAGAFVMRGAGCTINDMWDRDLDGKVARTCDRPLVNGSMSIQQAFIFLTGQLSVGLLILLQLNWYSVFLGASSLGLVITYPLMKRITYWPQFILGMTFNWGILLGYSAVHNTIDWSICAPMYIAGICWTIVYDTIYAHQDIGDDLILGIKSTAIKFKENTKYWLSGFSTMMISCLTLSGIAAEQTWPYYSAVTLTAAHLFWQLHSLNIHNPKDCANKFMSNHYVGLLLFFGILLGNVFKKKMPNKDYNSLTLLD